MQRGEHLFRGFLPKPAFGKSCHGPLAGLQHIGVGAPGSNATSARGWRSGTGTRTVRPPRRSTGRAMEREDKAKRFAQGLTLCLTTANRGRPVCSPEFPSSSNSPPTGPQASTRCHSHSVSPPSPLQVHEVCRSGPPCRRRCANSMDTRSSSIVIGPAYFIHRSNGNAYEVSGGRPPPCPPVGKKAIGEALGKLGRGKRRG